MDNSSLPEPAPLDDFLRRHLRLIAGLALAALVIAAVAWAVWLRDSSPSAEDVASDAATAISEGDEARYDELVCDSARELTSMPVLVDVDLETEVTDTAELEFAGGSSFGTLATFPLGDQDSELVLLVTDEYEDEGNCVWGFATCGPELQDRLTSLQQTMCQARPRP